MARFWFGLRTLAYLTTFVHAAFVGVPRAEPAPPVSFVVVAVLVPPLMLLGVIGVQAVNPFSAEQWERPRHDSNPLRLTHPLNFFHFGGFCMIAVGAGALVHLFGAGGTPIAADALPIAFGLALLLGVRLCELVFRKKMAARDLPT